MREETADGRDTNVHVDTGQTKTGNRQRNMLIGGEESRIGGPQWGDLQGLADFINNTDNPEDYSGGGGDGGSGGDEDAFMAEWLSILEELKKPLDMNDPLVQNILTGARTATLSDLAGRGIHGGYSEANAQQAYVNSAAQLQHQKRDAYLRALQAAGDYEQRANTARTERDRWAYENDPARGIGGLIGGGIGTLGGALLGGLAGNPLGGASIGAQFGSQVGSGIGGMFAPQPRMRGWSGPSRRTAGGY